MFTIGDIINQVASECPNVEQWRRARTSLYDVPIHAVPDDFGFEVSHVTTDRQYVSVITRYRLQPSALAWCITNSMPNTETNYAMLTEVCEKLNRVLAMYKLCSL